MEAEALVLWVSGTGCSHHLPLSFPKSATGALDPKDSIFLVDFSWLRPSRAKMLHATSGWLSSDATSSWNAFCDQRRWNKGRLDCFTKDCTAAKWLTPTHATSLRRTWLTECVLSFYPFSSFLTNFQIDQKGSFLPFFFFNSWMFLSSTERFLCFRASIFIK